MLFFKKKRGKKRKRDRNKKREHNRKETGRFAPTLAPVPASASMPSNGSLPAMEASVGINAPSSPSIPILIQKQKFRLAIPRLNLKQRLKLKPKLKLKPHALTSTSTPPKKNVIISRILWPLPQDLPVSLEKMRGIIWYEQGEPL